MKLNHINHIFFDLDHTLWDFDKNSKLAFKRIFELNNIKVDINDFTKVYEPINFEYWKLYREEKITKKELRYGRLKKSFDSLEYEIEDKLIDILAVDYITYLTTFNHLFDDTIDILSYLKPNYKLHIITNGFEEAQTKKIKNSGLSKYFISVTNSEQAGVKKPNPIIFNHALKIANAQVSKSIMIGDSYEADVLGALNINMEAIHFNYRNEKLNGKHLSVNKLSELKKYL
ncbi:YjjG family noncanonical pyrimidine nucleotidase [Ichthyenterobacterium sp. W332]|uniref:YjjG family noncanonical pyrimidine nucleotidase n=1 Tax=Microcosmobacter mediterraneus TaxID=3075607 RepID=A0ABU2YMA2_9FLAO|nr:YjjG family noncanonical pyrimidine nucleotidase [Ichthyenterobacterium sp. W332]MDT0558400.1 YjjG family noncanonical pyrimidine nucleotidase [Ichthyenterobacterium sp. W332]